MNKKVIVFVLVVCLLSTLALAIEPTQGGKVFIDFNDLSGRYRSSKDRDEFKIGDYMCRVYDDAHQSRTSRFEAEIVDDSIYGAKVLAVSWLLDEWCGIEFKPNDYYSQPKCDWNNYGSLSFYIKGKKKAKYTLRITDEGNEVFISPVMKITSDDWQKVIVPLNKFTPFDRYIEYESRHGQPHTYKRDGYIDSPVRGIGFAPASFRGDVRLAFFEVIP